MHRASGLSGHVGIRIEGGASFAQRRVRRSQSTRSGQLDVCGLFSGRRHLSVDTGRWFGTSGSSRRPGGGQQLGIVAVGLSPSRRLRITCHFGALAKVVWGDRSCVCQGNPADPWRTAECVHVSSRWVFPNRGLVTRRIAGSSKRRVTRGRFGQPRAHSKGRLTQHWSRRRRCDRARRGSVLAVRLLLVNI